MLYLNHLFAKRFKSICMTSNRFYLMFLLAASVLFFSCEKDTETGELENETSEDTPTEDVRYYKNPPYPVDADTLRILAIGNSFSLDGMTYVDALVKSAGIDEKRLCLYEATKAGASFSTWLSVLKSEEAVNIWRKAGKVKMKDVGTLPQLLAQPWDVIIVQQVSNQSYKWETYSCLKEYVDFITSSCLNPNVCFAFQLVWSHTPDEMPHVLQGNIACCEKMSKEIGIDVIIPTGIAIQLARGTTLNDDAYMTRDNWHLNRGMACYIASCTWFETLLRPVFGIPVVGNTAKPDGDYSDADILLGQQCAERAVKNPYAEVW